MNEAILAKLTDEEVLAVYDAAMASGLGPDMEFIKKLSPAELIHINAMETDVELWNDFVTMVAIRLDVTFDEDGYIVKGRGK
jgi:hypothetical protein